MFIPTTLSAYNKHHSNVHACIRCILPSCICLWREHITIHVQQAAIKKIVRWQKYQNEFYIELRLERIETIGNHKHTRSHTCTLHPEIRRNEFKVSDLFMQTIIQTFF